MMKRIMCSILSILAVATLLFPTAVLAQITCDKSVTFNIASGSTATTLVPTTGTSPIKVCAIGATGTTATTSNLIHGTTVTIASNSVEKARYIIGTQHLALGSGVGLLFAGEPGYAVVITCGTGTCAGTLTYAQ